MGWPTLVSGARSSARIERRPPKPQVGGSSPPGPAMCGRSLAWIGCRPPKPATRVQIPAAAPFSNFTCMLQNQCGGRDSNPRGPDAHQLLRLAPWTYLGHPRPLSILEPGIFNCIPDFHQASILLTSLGISSGSLNWWNLPLLSLARSLQNLAPLLILPPV